MSAVRCDECMTAYATVCGTWCAACYDTLKAGPPAVDPAPATAGVVVVDDDGSPYRLEAWAASDGYRWGQP